MSAEIYKFPRKKPLKGFRIPLYDEGQVYLVLMVVNTFGSYPEKIIEKTLNNVDPLDIIECISKARASQIFSTKTKQLLYIILTHIETVEQ
jgi:hypothetical protein